MKNSTKLKIALLLVLVAVGIHIYLTDHYFGLNFGTESGESICNISSKINCDTVTASPFSAFAGIPIALWGAITNVALAFLIFTWLAGWTNNLLRLSRYAVLLAGFIAGMSLIMGSISTLLIGSYCLFCMTEYALSFIIFGLLFSARERPTTSAQTKSWSIQVLEIFGPAKAYLAYLVGVPLVTVFFHQSILAHYDVAELPAIVKLVVAEWQSSPEVQLNEPPTLVKGSAGAAKMIISEFADFRCPHCRHAASPVKAFVNSHPDTKLHFYVFPLDNRCNDVMQAGDGISCYLAKAVYCTGKLGDKGWVIHDAIYANQDGFISNGSIEYTKSKVGEYLTANNIKTEDVTACIESPETDKSIRAQAKLGTDSGVKGTPTFYVNGRKLQKGQLIPVLEAVHATLSK